MRIDKYKCCDSKLVRQCRDLIGEKLFKVFTDESRQQIFLILLESGEMTVNDVSNKIKINQSNVSRHLKMMKDSGIAATRKDGREIYYRLNLDKLKHHFRDLINILDECC